MEFKGTKGKWKLSTVITYGRQMVDLGEFKGSVDVWYHSGDSMTKEEAQANALLMSKSPELLEALYNLLKWSAHFPPAMNDELEVANRLIKEATEIK
jgi:hypothetical protein